MSETIAAFEIIRQSFISRRRLRRGISLIFAHPIVVAMNFLWLPEPYAHSRAGECSFCDMPTSYRLHKAFLVHPSTAELSD